MELEKKSLVGILSGVKYFLICILMHLYFHEIFLNNIKLNYCKKVFFFLIHLVLVMNKIEGTPILKLAMVERL